MSDKPSEITSTLDNPDLEELEDDLDENDLEDEDLEDLDELEGVEDDDDLEDDEDLEDDDDLDEDDLEDDEDLEDDDDLEDDEDLEDDDLEDDEEVAFAAPVPEDFNTFSGFVAILGKPNVGKSTLLNTFLGVKVAPITSKPQTTRRGVRGIYSIDDRQLVFVDTPGLHRAKDALGEYMNREVRGALVDVDLILWVVDLRRPPGDEDKDVARLLKGIDPNVPIYLIGNKVDAAKYPDEALRLYSELVPHIKEARSLSALNDPETVYALRDELMGLLPKGPFYFPDNIRSDQSREDWVGELIRESAMMHLKQELPYAVAVKVLEWSEPRKEDEPLYLLAEIWVERSNHRMIALGKGGSMIKEIGRTARKQLEIFLSTRIYLELEVVVHKNWREDRESLRELGYEN